MDVVDDIRKAASTVSREASKFSQVQYQQLRLRSLQGDVARAEQELGSLVMDLRARGELVHQALDAPEAKVQAARATVAEKEAEIAGLKAEYNESRDAYVERLKMQLGEWSADIETLKARAGRISVEAKSEYEEQLAGLRRQRDALAARVRDLQEAGDDAWDELKKNVQEAWDRAKVSFQETMARFGRSNGGSQT